MTEDVNDVRVRSRVSLREDKKSGGTKEEEECERARGLRKSRKEKRIVAADERQGGKKGE